MDAEALPLLQRFRALRRQARPHERGYAFERLLAELLRRHGFHVRMSPPATRPRQSDLVARDDGVTLLASVKWLRTPIGSGEVDELCARLRRMPPGTIGCLFSMSPIRRVVLDEAASVRSAHEILLFSPSEIVALFEERLECRETIDEKRSRLTVEGRSTARARTSRGRNHAQLDFPVAAGRIELGGRAHKWLPIPHTGWGDLLFASRLPEATWSVRGSGTSLTLSPRFDRFEELVKFLAVVPAAVGLSADGTFAIHQTTVAWHGFGLRTLFEACRMQRYRYKRARGPFHHSEQCVFFAGTRAGWAALTFQLDARGSSRVSHCELELRLPGIPVDVAPYRRLMRQAGHAAHFELLDHEREVESARIPGEVQLDVLGFVTYPDRRWVRGIVCKNPFRSESIPLPQFTTDAVVANLRDPEIVICSMGQEHEVGDRVDGYWLQRVKAIPSALVQPLELRCEWGKLTYRRADEEAKALGAPTQTERALAEARRRPRR
jgi:hypothetical protein